MQVQRRVLVVYVVLALLQSGLVWAVCPPGDLDGDCRVDTADLQVFSEQWLTPPESPADLNGDDTVDLADFRLLAAGWRTQGIPLYINELLASNTRTNQDPQGEHDDWIEIYNAGDEPIDIGGMYLTDDLSAPQKWHVPSEASQLTTVPARGHLLIWADGDVDDEGLHAGFSLSATGEEIALFDRDGTTLIDRIAFDAQEADVSFGRWPDGADSWQPFASPTPGAENQAIYEGLLAKPEISVEAGFYEGEILVSLSTQTEGATLYYTTDGSEPYTLGGRFPSGRAYSGPLPITKTTCLRVKAIKPGWRPSPTATRTYLFLSDVVRQSGSVVDLGPGWPPAGSVSGQSIDYGMDPEVVNDPKYTDLVDDALRAIPSISLVTDLANLFDSATGIYVHAGSAGRAWERPVSVELLHPDGTEGFQIDAGLRIRGGFSRSGSNPKHAFRLLFRPEYAGTLEYPLFADEGTDRFENVDLRTSQNYSWSFQGDGQNTMVREVFSRDLQGEMGHPYTRSRYYHLYINGQYWGLYQTQERSEASYAQSYLGGDEDDYDVVKADTSIGRAMLATDGNMEAYRRLYDAAIAGPGDHARYCRIQGLNPDGTPNPDYERLLDVDNLIDFMLIDYYTGDRDGSGSRFGNIPNNTYAILNRENPDGWKWFQHDSEHTLGAGSSETNMVTPFTTAGAQWRYFNPHWLHEQLARANANYRMRFADHVYRHFFHGGLLTPQAATARIQHRAEQIEMAIIAESARWGDAKRSRPFTKQDWQNEIDRIVNNYLPSRTQVVLGQFKSVGWYPGIDPPTFNQHGGYVASGFVLQMSGTAATFYYTLDGSDPRHVTTTGAGTVSPDASPYTGSFPLTESTHVKVRAFDAGEWSALNEALFAVGPIAESLRISEIMYHPADTGHPDDPNTEYIELVNIGDEAVNLKLVRFTRGIDFAFPSVELAPGHQVLVVKDVAAFEGRYGRGLPVAGQYNGSLDNAGERIELRDAAGKVIHSFRYRDGWYDSTDGAGFSLTVKDPVTADPNDYGSKELWRPSHSPGGSPGFSDTGMAEVPPEENRQPHTPVNRMRTEG
jgi:hypothetical protein